jgi:hypothetical protein
MNTVTLEPTVILGGPKPIPSIANEQEIIDSNPPTEPVTEEDEIIDSHPWIEPDTQEEEIIDSHPPVESVTEEAEVIDSSQPIEPVAEEVEVVDSNPPIESVPKEDDIVDSVPPAETIKVVVEEEEEEEEGFEPLSPAPIQWIPVHDALDEEEELFEPNSAVVLPAQSDGARPDDDGADIAALLEAIGPASDDAGDGVWDAVALETTDGRRFPIQDLCPDVGWCPSPTGTYRSVDMSEVREHVQFSFFPTREQAGSPYFPPPPLPVIVQLTDGD